MAVVCMSFAQRAQQECDMRSALGPSLPHEIAQHPPHLILRLLELTRPASTWQPHLVQLLGQHILEAGARQVIAFLQHVLFKGKEAFQHHKCCINGKPHNSGYLLQLDRKLTPKMIDIDCWKRVLVALGFEIEQPDGYHTLEYVDVLLGDGVLMPALDGMLLLLSLINGLTWPMLRMILNLTPEEAIRLNNLIDQSSTSITDATTAKAFMSRYPDEMSQMGFHRQSRGVYARNTSNQKQAHICETIFLVLTGLFHDGPQDEGTFI